MTDNLSDETDAEEQDVDEIEKELLDAMRKLSRKNKSIEEYLDGLARTPEKPAEEENETQKER